MPDNPTNRIELPPNYHDTATGIGVGSPEHPAVPESAEAGGEPVYREQLAAIHNLAKDQPDTAHSETRAANQPLQPRTDWVEVPQSLADQKRLLEQIIRDHVDLNPKDATQAHDVNRAIDEVNAFRSQHPDTLL